MALEGLGWGAGSLPFQALRVAGCNVITCFIGRALTVKIGTEGIYTNLPLKERGSCFAAIKRFCSFVRWDFVLLLIYGDP